MEFSKAPSPRPAWLRVDRVFGGMGIPKDSAAWRHRFEEAMEERRADERPEDRKPVWRGWGLGEEPFRQELLRQVHEMAATHHYGEEIGQSAEEMARRVIAEKVGEAGLDEAGLGSAAQRRRWESENRVPVAERDDG